MMIKNLLLLIFIFVVVACSTPGAVQTSERLVNAGANQAHNNKASPALLRAAVLGSADKILKLLSEGADPNYKDERGMTPLHLAVHNGNLDAIRVLLDHGAKTDVATKEGITPLSAAIETGNTDAVNLLIAGAADVNFSPIPQFGPLYTAILGGSHELLELLIQAGANVNLDYYIEDNHVFPLVMAKDEETFNILIKHHSDPNQFVDREGELPFLFKLIYSNSYEKLEIALKGGADANIRSRISSTTPLHFAVLRQNIEAVRLLLKYRADIHSQDADLRTPIDMAITEGSEELIALLKQ